jgi:uncharacterized protein YpuA (DUF1002 family)
MFKWDELEDLKKVALDVADNVSYGIEDRKLNAVLVVIYQNEQILRELKSIGWKLKEINDRGVL